MVIKIKQSPPKSILKSTLKILKTQVCPFRTMYYILWGGVRMLF